MVDIRAEWEQSTTALGYRRKGHHGVEIACYFNEELFDQIKVEAVRRGWTLAHMVRHLCEASIDGIK